MQFVQRRKHKIDDVGRIITIVVAHRFSILHTRRCQKPTAQTVATAGNRILAQIEVYL